MPVSIYQLGYKKLSRIVFEWQDADRASLLSLFIVMEVTLHWLWCGFVWLGRDTFAPYMDMSLLYPMWSGITVMGLLFLWLVGHLARIKNNTQLLHYWQIVLIVIYSLYIAGIVLVMGHSGLLSGISLVGGTMLGMMLVRRSYMWRAFLWQVLLIVLVTMVQYLNIHLPNLHQFSIPPSDYIYNNEITTLENAIDTGFFDYGTLTEDMRLASSMFWRSTHLYLALPKAIFIVYVFRTLLLILDDSKKEVLKYANQDGLTSLSNRRFGLSQMQQTITNTAVGQHSSIILLDLDWFKGINDKYGHDVGDQVLCEVATILKQMFSEIGVVSRYGGEEFLVILPNTGHDKAMQVANKLRENIAQHRIKVSKYLSFQITASLGVYTLFYDELLRVKGQWAQANKSSEYSQSSRQNQYQKEKGVINHELSRAHDGKISQGKVNKRARAIPLIDKRTMQYIEHQQNEQLSNKICHGAISAADKALYKAKERGRNLVVSANELLGESIIPEPRFRA